MKKTKLLKTITNIIYYLYALGVIITPIAAIIALIVLNTKGIVIDEKKYTNISFATIFWGIAAYATSIALLYCLSLFRKIIDLFLQIQIFHPEVINLFKKIGKYLIIIGFIVFFTSFIPLGYSYLTSNETGYTNTYSFNLHFEFLNFKWAIILGAGLFFQVLSEILKKAQSLKLENDLTI